MRTSSSWFSLSVFFWILSLTNIIIIYNLRWILKWFLLLLLLCAYWWLFARCTSVWVWVREYAVCCLFSGKFTATKTKSWYVWFSIKCVCTESCMSAVQLNRSNFSRKYYMWKCCMLSVSASVSSVCLVVCACADCVLSLSYMCVMRLYIYSPCHI